MLKYPPDDLISDVILYRGTVHSLGHRLDIAIDESSALLLLIKYPELKILSQYHTESRDHSLRDITVRIA